MESSSIYITSNNDFANKLVNSIPKTGSLSEYKSAYLQTRDTNRQSLVKLKDTLSFGSKSYLAEPSYMTKNENMSTSFASLPLNSYRMGADQPNQMSWYKGDYGFYGAPQPNEIRKNSSRPGSTLHRNKSLQITTAHNPYKADHIRRFDEFNSGLVDTYSLSKGGALLAIRQNGNANAPTEANSNENYQVKIKQRPHDLRSVWIPKKFEGRNMFASHIGTTIFPDSARKPATSQYNDNYDFTSESKKTFEKPTYDRIEKTVRYSVSHENKLVGAVVPYVSQDRYREEPVEANPNPLRSSYQTDFDSASLLSMSMSNMNKSSSHANTNLIKVNNNAFTSDYKTLKDLQKRRDQIDQQLLKSSY